MNEKRVRYLRARRGVLLGVMGFLTLGVATVPATGAQATPTPTLNSGPLGTGGTILAIGHVSITVGPRPEVSAYYKARHVHVPLPANLTCALDRTSPSLAGFRSGEYVAVQCPSGTLTAIQPDRQWAGGTILKLSARSIKIGSDLVSFPGMPSLPPTDLVCSRGPRSPAVGHARVGGKARVVCLGGVLTRILPGNHGWNGYAESGGGSVVPPSTAGY